MAEEKVYVMDDGREYILGSRIELGGKRFLLLYEEKTDNAFVAYEEDGFLKHVDQTFPNYKNIFELLMAKINDELK